LLAVVIALSLLSCGGATTTGGSAGTGTTGVTAGGTGGSGGSGGSGGMSGGSGGGGTTGGSGGSGGGAGGTGGTGGSGGSGGTGGGGGGSPVVIQSFAKPERLGLSESLDLAVDSKGNIDLAVVHRPGLDPLYSMDFLRLPAGAAVVKSDTTLPLYSLHQHLATDASGNIYVTWLASPATSSNPSFLNGVFSRSDDGGATFTSPVSLFDRGATPELVLDSSRNIFVVWSTLNNPGFQETATFARSTDGGKTFSAGTPLSDQAKMAVGPHIAVTSKDRIDVIWQYNSMGTLCDSSNGFRNCSPCDIFFAQSADGGTSFSAPVNVSNSSGCAGLDDSSGLGGPDENDQQMQVDFTGNVNIVWDDSIAGVMFRRSTDGGSGFSTSINVSPSQGVFPKVATDSQGGIDVIWAPSDGSAALVFSRSSDGGVTFSQPKSMGAGQSASAGNAQLATDANGDVDVLWAETHRLQFSQSFDGGATFSSPITLATDTTNFSDISPDIIAGGPVKMVVEPNGDVDLAFTADQYAGDDRAYLWFSRGTTSGTASPPPLFLTACCSDGKVGMAYTGDAIATGGTPSYLLTAAGLPPGLFLQGPSAGGGGRFWQILGTPTTAGSFTANFTLADSAGASLTYKLVITIAAQ
jgi:hypothetical protein